MLTRLHPSHPAPCSMSVSKKGGSLWVRIVTSSAPDCFVMATKTGSTSRLQPSKEVETLSPHCEASIVSTTESTSFTTSANSLPSVGEAQHGFVQPQSASLSSNVDNESFSELAVNKLQFSQLDHLYGRDTEIKILRDALSRVKSNPSNKSCNRELVLISGYSGTGKSALARQVEVPTKKANGFFVTGKFDLQHRGEPFSGIASACAEFCDQVESIEERPWNSSLDGTTFEEIQRKLLDELGSEKTLLTRIIPGLRRIFGFETNQEGKHGNDGGKGSHLETRNRFIYAFRRLLRTAASFGTVVLALDDLQWGDAASFDLLEALITDADNSSLMIIGSYRSNEVDNSHRVSKMLRDLRSRKEEAAFNITEVEIGDLRQSEVNLMLADLLRSDNETTKRLSDVICKKTCGNVFHVVELVTSLARQKLLTFNLALAQWQWDADEIEAKTQATNNVVDLVKEKMRTELSRDTLTHLPIAAFLGASFDTKTFELVSKSIGANVLLDSIEEGGGDLLAETDSNSECSFVACCLKEGLLVSNGGRDFKWIHDKVQEAALALIKDSERDTFGNHIGRILFENLSPGDLHANLFMVVNLMNRGVDALSLPVEKRVELARLNLKAGRKSINFCAFLSAQMYLQKALDLLPEDHWISLYNLSLEIFNDYADAEYCLSNYDRMNRLCEEVLGQKNRPLEDTFLARRLVCEGFVAGGEYVKAQNACLQSLQLIGCKFAKSDTMRTIATILGVVRAKGIVERTSLEDINALPRCEDKEKIFGHRIMETLIAAAYPTGSNLVALSLLREFEWTFKHGFIDETNLCFGGVALVLTFVLGEVKTGKKCADFANTITKRTNTRRTFARHVTTSYGMTRHIADSLSDCMRECLGGYQVGMEMGDVAYAQWCIHFYLQHAQRAGKPLRLLEGDYAIYTRQMKETGQMPVYATATVHWQAIQNLMGMYQAENVMELTGTVMVEKDFLKEMVSSKNKAALTVVNNRKIYLGCLLGQHEAAANIALAMGEKFYVDSPGWPSGIDSFLFGAVSCVSAYRETRKRKYLKYAKHQAKKLAGWMKVGSPNFAHWTLLLNAELTSLTESNRSQAGSLFQNAIIAAARMGRLSEHALIRERYAAFLSTSKSDRDRSEVDYQLQQASQLYDEWGASAKVEQLRKNVDTVFPSELTLQL